MTQWLRPQQILTEGEARVKWTVFRTPLPSDISQVGSSTMWHRGYDLSRSWGQVFLPRQKNHSNKICTRKKIFYKKNHLNVLGKSWIIRFCRLSAFCSLPRLLKKFFTLFCIFFWRARVCWPLLCLCRPFCIFERCLYSNPESCHSKQARYQSSLPSPST